MTKNNLSYPKVCRRKDGKYYIDFKLNNIRYRLFSGKLINSSLSPNSYPLKMRNSASKKLAKQVYDFIVINNFSLEKKLSKVEEFDKIIELKLSEPLSENYRKTLIIISNILRKELITKSVISVNFLSSIPLKYHNNTSYNTIRKHLNVIINFLIKNNFKIEQLKLKSRKQKEKLHKPVLDVKSLLERIKDYNKNLHLCCLLTYGCLLRPHQEIRNLKWSNFSSDLSQISLSGEKVKSRKNRIVPVPNYLREHLKITHSDMNIFSNSVKPFNEDYFKGLWRKFKKLNQDIDRKVTIYSFRHSGAIDIFKRTGSISKLQKSMGHSSIKVSLTYLRGLEIPELKQEDMPTL